MSRGIIGNMLNLEFLRALKSSIIAIMLLVTCTFLISCTPTIGSSAGQSRYPYGWSTSFEYPVGDFPENFGLGDLDSDGDLEIVACNLFDDTVSVYFNTGKGKYTNRTDFVTGTPGNGPRMLAIADVNEDNNNDLDILVINYYGGTVTVLTNDGTGNFSQPINYTCLDDPTCIRVADVNGDSYIDVIINGYYNDKIGIMINDGTGAFDLKYTYNVGSRPREFYLLDVGEDANEDIDIVTANLLDDTITVYTNIGNGDFTYMDTYSTDGGPRSITAGDIDNDGDTDIIIANRHANTISALINRGDGNYSARYDYDCGQTPIKVTLGDLDNNGFLDIGVIVLNENKLVIFNNTGSGSFPSSYFFNCHQGPYCVEFANLDNDNDLDIIYSSAYKDKVFTIFRDLPPTIQILEPDGVDDEADLEYTIKWVGSDPDKHNILSVDLFYNFRLEDEPGVGRGDTRQMDPGSGQGVYLGIPIIFGTENDGEYTWDCSKVPNGSYQIGATIHDDYNNYCPVLSDGNVTISHNVPPKVLIQNPPPEGARAHTSFTIRWSDSDPDDSAIINISYDDDNNSENGYMGRIASNIQEDGDGDNDKYNWKTNKVFAGEYYIVLEITDDRRPTIINYSEGMVEVNHDITTNEAPDITILEPDGVDDMVDASFFITWIDSDADDNAEITLFYDTDDQGYDGLEIVSGIMEDDDGKSGGSEINVYHWNCSELDEADYYIYAKIDDSVKAPLYNYSSGPLTILHQGEGNNKKPKITILEPDGTNDEADSFYMIKWTDEDPEDNAGITLYYNSQPELYTGRGIVKDIQEDDIDDYYIWDTLEIPEGDYYIYAKIDDYRNDAQYTISPGPITIEHDPPPINVKPFIEILEPDGINDVANASYTITWVDYDPDDDAFISLFYDINSSGFNGVLIQDLLSEDGVLDQFVWNTLFIPEGEYYIYAIINDNFNLPFSKYSLGKVTIDHTVQEVDTIIRPEADIASPQSNSEYTPEDEIFFDATESQGQNLSFLWKSDRDGTIGTNGSFKAKLSEGTHEIKVYIKDEYGQSSSDTTYIIVKEETEEEEIIKDIPNWQLWAFIIIIIILIVVMTLIAVLGKKKSASKDEKSDEKKGKPEKKTEKKEAPGKKASPDPAKSKKIASPKK